MTNLFIIIKKAIKMNLAKFIYFELDEIAGRRNFEWETKSKVN